MRSKHWDPVEALERESHRKFATLLLSDMPGDLRAQVVALRDNVLEYADRYGRIAGDHKGGDKQVAVYCSNKELALHEWAEKFNDVIEAADVATDAKGLIAESIGELPF